MIKHQMAYFFGTRCIILLQILTEFMLGICNVFDVKSIHTNCEMAQSADFVMT